MLTYQCFTAVLLLIYGSLFPRGISYCLRAFWCAVVRMSELELEQRMNIKFLVKLGKSGNEIREMLVQVYGDNAVKKTANYKWVKHFSEGRESVTDEKRSGQPATSRTEENIAKIHEIVCENRRLTVRSIAEQVNLDRETVRKILTEDLYMRKLCAKMVPKELTEDKSKEESQFAKTFWRGKMTFWAVSSQVMMKQGSTNTTLKQSGKVHNGRLPIPHDQKNSVSSNQESKQCCWLFFILEGLFIMNLYQLDKQSTRFTIWKYWEGCVKELDGNDPNFLPTTRGSNHDNAPAPMALSVREFLATKQITVLEHPAYSPDLTPSDFLLFPKIKEILKGRHFDDIDDIRSSTTATLKAIPQNQFQNCFEGCTRHWHRCIASQGEYFEGDHGGIQQ